MRYINLFNPTLPKYITITVSCPMRNSPFVLFPLHKAKTFSPYSFEIFKRSKVRGRSPFRKRQLEVQSENLTFGVLGGVWIVNGNGLQLISCYFKIVKPQPIKSKVVLTCVTSPTYLQPLSLCRDVTCTLHSPSSV